MFDHPALAIDTCGELGTVALVDFSNDATAVTCVSQTELGGRSAAAQLMPAIDALLRNAALDLRALRTLVVVNGPGSFTGTRVGLSTAKGLAHAAGLPLVAISRLAVLASLADDQADFLVSLDAGRNEFYARRGQREWLASFNEVAAATDGGTPLIIAEDRLEARLANWSSQRVGPPRLVGPLDACAAAHAASPRVRSGDREDLATLDANYLRRSDAELFARPASASP
jgi:tRNA threonylcarbamoyladenosine biosynthesis protein TsaB